MTPENASTKPKVAVIEGWHPFDVFGWHDLWRSQTDLDCYIQTLDNWACNGPDYRAAYDTALFYNMTMTPTKDFEAAVLDAMEWLGETGQGIVILHHALLSLPENSTLNKLIGIDNRKFDYHLDQDLTVDVPNDAHPISKGIAPFKLHDETYTMDSAGEGSDILFTTSHSPSTTTLGWTRTHKQSRVFCFQPGHDRRVWDDPVFREILRRGILWAAKKL
jgi:uncharacterized protein